MNPAYLLDTDWVIHYLNGRSDVVEKVDGFRHMGLALSVISLAELYEGVYHSTNPDGNERALHDFLADVDIIGVDEAICKRFGRERGRLRKQAEGFASKEGPWAISTCSLLRPVFKMSTPC